MVSMLSLFQLKYSDDIQVAVLSSSKHLIRNWIVGRPGNNGKDKKNLLTFSHKTNLGHIYSQLLSHKSIRMIICYNTQTISMFQSRMTDHKI